MHPSISRSTLALTANGPGLTCIATHRQASPLEAFLWRCRVIHVLLWKSRLLITMDDTEVIAYNVAAFITALFLLESGADKFVNHTAIVARRSGINEAAIALLTAGAEWEEVSHRPDSLLRSWTHQCCSSSSWYLPSPRGGRP